MGKKYLLTRFGGLGDTTPVGVVAKVLNDRGHTVDLALRDDGTTKQSSLFENCEYVNKIFDYEMVGPWGDRCVSYKHGKKSIETIYKDYDEVVDYMNIVENNSTSPNNIQTGPNQDWKRTRNSNYENWHDLHLSWANIDPRSVKDSEKKPSFKLSKQEQKYVEDIRKQFSKVFCIHPVASSLARTWYQARDLIPMLQEKYEGCLVAAWDPNKNDWSMISDKPFGNIKMKITDPIRRSMVMVAASDVFVGADTGFTHVAEGLGVKHICIYSTVPWWTRAQYYENQEPIDMGVHNPQYYTFSLGIGDPLNIAEGLDNLTDREAKIKDLYDRQVHPQEAAKELNTDQHGLNMELKCLQQKMESFSRIQSKSLSSVTVDMVLKKIEGLTNE